MIIIASMKPSLKLSFLSAACMAVCLAAVSCSHAGKYQQIIGYAQGGTYSVTCHNHNRLLHHFASFLVFLR